MLSSFSSRHRSDQTVPSWSALWLSSQPFRQEQDFLRGNRTSCAGTGTGAQPCRGVMCVSPGLQTHFILWFGFYGAVRKRPPCGHPHCSWDPLTSRAPSNALPVRYWWVPGALDTVATPCIPQPCLTTWETGETWAWSFSQLPRTLNHPRWEPALTRNHAGWAGGRAQGPLSSQGAPGSSGENTDPTRLQPLSAPCARTLLPAAARPIPQSPAGLAECAREGPGHREGRHRPLPLVSTPQLLEICICYCYTTK